LAKKKKESAQDLVINQDYELVATETLKKHPRNVNRGDLVAIEGSIAENGFYGAIVAQRSTGHILAGNHRFDAAVAAGMANVPVTWVDVDDDRALRILLADNRTTRLGHDDQEALAALLQEILTDTDTLAGTGFDEAALDALLAEVGVEQVPAEGLTDEDSTPEAPEQPATVPGDLWILGRHRLLCGDSTSIDAVERLMDGEKADMVFTDPPYNADYSSRVDKDKRKPWGGILNDCMSPEEFDGFLSAVVGVLVSFARSESSVYCCIDWKRYPQMARAFAAGFTHKATIIWDKKHFALGTYYRTQYEMVLFGVLGDKLSVWNAGHDERDVWSINRESTGQYVHPTQKPVELIERALNNSSDSGDAVLDLFGGSGSTLIACEKTGRNARLMELDPKYCDVIVKRWEDFTGKKAVLDGDGRTFAELKSERTLVAA
jgi:DNA modification methylase